MLVVVLCYIYFITTIHIGTESFMELHLRIPFNLSIQVFIHLEKTSTLRYPPLQGCLLEIYFRNDYALMCCL